MRYQEIRGEILDLLDISDNGDGSYIDDSGKIVQQIRVRKDIVDGFVLLQVDTTPAADFFFILIHEKGRIEFPNEISFTVIAPVDSEDDGLVTFSFNGKHRVFRLADIINFLIGSK